MKRITHIFILCFLINITHAQTLDSISEIENLNDLDAQDHNRFKEYYPIQVKPRIAYMTPTSSGENMIFEAKPTVYYNFTNNMREVLSIVDREWATAFYISFQPHLRMYDENSKPVKMPSYKAILGLQFLKKMNDKDFLTVALESGHYSNGQSGCAFAEDLEDGSPACISLHQTINDQSDLSALLNRRNGNFSTNLTKAYFNYRINSLGNNDVPVNTHSFTASYEFYHNPLLGLFDIGGYTQFDIGIYGRHRFGFQYEHIRMFCKKLRVTAQQKFELIEGAHPFVRPLRSETTLSFYPFKNDFGFFITYAVGHDDYNYRFVDEVNHVSMGVNWDWFSPFEIKRSENLRLRR